MQILEWSKADFSEGLSIKAMSENESVKEIQITLAKESVLNEHKAPSKISVQVLSGRIEFGVEGEVFELKALDCIFVDAGVLHHLKGIENSILRLSIYKK
ncbi:cupin domain-containing protein [uncultured Helicobacter sp.]|uniref:cupin domain-containing protein n=1 Tax=uncultured Helicobacter sp. TaxID=175537 RepID=UPI00260FCB26|nr:cupin domain-containing protein [uncultured Helicobacter sp.]